MAYCGAEDISTRCGPLVSSWPIVPICWLVKRLLKYLSNATISRGLAEAEILD